MPSRRVFALVLSILAAGATMRGQDLAYRAAIEEWREAHEARLRADDGWLTVVGLSWLRSGGNSAGSDPSSDILLPARSAPVRVGVFRFNGSRIEFEAADQVPVRINGKTLTSATLRADTSGFPDMVTVGSIAMFVIKRGDRYGVRIRDSEAEARRTFKGLRWFPVDERYRVTARFVPYEPAKKIPIVNVLGDVQEMSSPGYVVFTLEGREYRLDPVVEGPGSRQLFFILRDATSGGETYPAGRFLYTDPPRDGQVVLDFNKAENPPCAFTAFATCPLPPPQNALPGRVRAGETYAGRKD